MPKRAPAGASKVEDMASPAAGGTSPAPQALPGIAPRARRRNERMAGSKVECNACPVLCQISPGRSGACDRYANQDGRLVRVVPVVLLRRTLAEPDPAVVAFAPPSPAPQPEAP